MQRLGDTMVSELRVRYYPDADILTIDTGEPQGSTTSMDWHLEVVASLAAPEPCSKVVALEIQGAHAYLPLGQLVYDEEADIQLFGAKDGATVQVENGDLVGYWKPDPTNPSDFIPLGVALCSARRWLGPIKIESVATTADA